jgi:hypothetical protein
VEIIGLKGAEAIVRCGPSAVRERFSFGNESLRAFRGAADASGRFIGPRLWVPHWLDLTGVKLFSEKLLAIPLSATSVSASFTRHVLSSIEIDTNSDVHFDGPKMDETSEATHAVKGLGCLKRT